jgi:hypothetical protein
LNLGVSACSPQVQLAFNHSKAFHISVNTSLAVYGFSQYSNHFLASSNAFQDSILFQLSLSLAALRILIISEYGVTLFQDLLK